MKEKDITLVPNDILDSWLPKLKEVELKVLMYVIRKTIGSYKTKANITLSELTKVTGCSRGNISKAAQALESYGLIRKETIGIIGSQKTFYELIFPVA